MGRLGALLDGPGTAFVAAGSQERNQTQQGIGGLDEPIQTGFGHAQLLHIERALKIKYVTGEVDGLSRIFDIIREGLVFDACMFYNNVLGSSAYNGFTAIASTTGVSWIADFDRFKVRGMQNKLKNDVVAKLRNIEY